MSDQNKVHLAKYFPFCNNVMPFMLNSIVHHVYADDIKESSAYNDIVLFVVDSLI